MIRSVIAATAILGGVTVLLAQSDQITERQATLFTAPPPADAKTRALPKIWENKADFEAKAAALAKAASEGKHSTLDELKASFPSVQQACANCHDNFRQPAPPAEGGKK
jgi:cytochrome c556